MRRHTVARIVAVIGDRISRWIERWEQGLADADTNRVVRPFEWGWDWLGIDDSEGAATQAAEFSRHSLACSGQFFEHTAPSDFRLSGQTLTFTSSLSSPYPENNTVWAEYFPARSARGRAVLVIPQWNSDHESHLNLCRLFQRMGISALRMSKAYHHRRMPPELQRADYHVSSNVGRTIHATRQSVIDARCCLDWLSARGYDRLGVLGTSLGSCIALLTVAHDARPKAAVFNHVSLRFADVVWTGVSCRHIRKSLEGAITREELDGAWSVISPGSYLGRLSGRDLRSLLVWAVRDTTFRPEFSRQVLQQFQELGLPHQVFKLPCGHYTTAKAPFVWMDAYAMVRFLHKQL